MVDEDEDVLKRWIAIMHVKIGPIHNTVGGSKFHNPYY
jgi:uncharacterized OsmC-like protein